MVSFEIFVKTMPPSLSELKVLPSFCFAFKIPDDVAASSKYVGNYFGLFPTHSLTNFSSKTLHSKSPNKENKTSERQLLSQAHK